MPDTSSPTLMRDYINANTVKELAYRIKKVNPQFKSAAFSKSIASRLKDLSLTERLDVVTDGLEKHLPGDFPSAADILTRSLGPKLEEQNSLDGIDLGSGNGFIVIAVTNYIARYGQNHFDKSMESLKEMTLRFSSELAIRHFIVRHEKKVLDIYKTWVKHPSVHVRRLVSESLRPRLPWAIRLQSFVKNPAPIIPYLDTLKTDPELYVRRSVANNLNDISKDHPDVVLSTLKRWSALKTKETDWLIRHATRTLIKQGHTGALKLLGYTSNPKITTTPLSISKKTIHLGRSLEFSIDIHSKSTKSQKLMIDYIIHFKKANGSHSPKVFKLAAKKLLPKSNLSIQKKHPLKKITTRKYYSGIHKLQIQINGKTFDPVAFELRIPD